MAARVESQYWRGVPEAVLPDAGNRPGFMPVDELTAEGRRLRDKIAGFWPGEILWHREMAPFTTFRVGGPATGIAFPEDRESLRTLVSGLESENIPWWVIGRGSNILVPDEGLAGIVIVLGRDFSGIDIVERIAAQGERAGDLRDHVPSGALVRVGAGCRMAKMVRWCVDNSFAGFEFAAGIPGSIGGALVMNAGAWGREIGEMVREVTVMDRAGVIFVLRSDQLSFAYRRCRELDGLTVIDATFLLEEGDRYVIDAACQVFIRKRLEKQPLQTASAGSFFKNPAGDAAGRLIEQAGLKGSRVGGAMVSEKHANFIVNIGNAKASDIHELMTVV
jgi:UDP-N-acetylmuramate dehydrogenase